MGLLILAELRLSLVLEAVDDAVLPSAFAELDSPSILVDGRAAFGPDVFSGSSEYLTWPSKIALG